MHLNSDIFFFSETFLYTLSEHARQVSIFDTKSSVPKKVWKPMRSRVGGAYMVDQAPKKEQDLQHFNII